MPRGIFRPPARGSGTRGRRRPSGWRPSPPRNGPLTSPGFEALPGNQREPLAMRYHGHQFRVYNPDLGDGRGFLVRPDARGRDWPTARFRGQGLGPHAVVARRRRPVDAEGRRPRGAGHRHAGGARRADLPLLRALRDRRGARAQRRAEPDAGGGPHPSVLQPHPLRLVSTPRGAGASRADPDPARSRDRDLLSGTCRRRELASPPCSPPSPPRPRT